MTLSNTYATEYSNNEEHINDMLDNVCPVEFDATDPTITGATDVRLLLLREMQIDMFLLQAKRQPDIGEPVLASVERIRELGYVNLLDAIVDCAGDETDQFNTRLCAAITAMAFQQYFIKYTGDDLLVLPAVKDLPLPDPKPFMMIPKSLH